MTTPLPPQAFDDEVRAITVALVELRVEYLQAYHMAWDKQVVDTVKVKGGGRSARSDAASLTKEGEGILKDHWFLRGRVSKTSYDLRRMLDTLRARHDELAEALERDERPHGGTWDPVMFGRTALRADVADAREQQAKRRAAGESLTGDDADVRARLGIGDR